MSALARRSRLASCSSRRACVQVAASSKPAQSMPGLAARLGSAAAATALAVTMALSTPVQPALANSPLVDSMRAEFAYTDLDKDGFITLNELGQLAAQMAEDKGMDLPNEDQLRLALGLFDLDRDGQLTSKEMMDSLGLVVLDENELKPQAEDGFFVTGDWWACYLFPC